jgi:triacylglycerol lipase
MGVQLAGFNTAFKSMKPQLISFVSSARAQGVHTIHCIGHSLGGALAPLCGEWIKAAHDPRPYVYSFGSPRVGFEGFARAYTREIESSHIFRAYHKTDIVPCIPIWPYVHTPNDGTEHFLPSPGILPGAEHHNMQHYKNSVEDKSWLALSGIKPKKRSDSSIAAWLKKEGPVGITTAAIGWIGDGIQFVLRKCLSGAEWLLSRAVGTSATIMDRLNKRDSHRKGNTARIGRAKPYNSSWHSGFPARLSS